MSKLYESYISKVTVAARVAEEEKKYNEAIALIRKGQRLVSELRNILGPTVAFPPTVIRNMAAMTMMESRLHPESTTKISQQQEQNGDGGGGSSSSGELQKQTTFNCEIEMQQAQKLGSSDYRTLIGMHREKLLIRQSLIYPYLYPFLFAIGKGILLYGSPGTGKTKLAQATGFELQLAIAKDAGTIDKQYVSLLALTGASLRGAYVGQTEKNIEAAWDCAQQMAEKAGPLGLTIIFLDELETIAGKRGNDPILNTSVTSLLQVIDGVKRRNQIRLIGATNKPWMLDNAILSRFPIKTFVDTPGDVARLNLLYQEVANFYTSGGLKEQVDLNKLINALKDNNNKDPTIIKQYADIAESYYKEYVTKYFPTKTNQEIY